MVERQDSNGKVWCGAQKVDNWDIGLPKESFLCIEQDYALGLEVFQYVFIYFLDSALGNRTFIYWKTRLS